MRNNLSSSYGAIKHQSKRKAGAHDERSDQTLTPPPPTPPVVPAKAGTQGMGGREGPFPFPHHSHPPTVIPAKLAPYPDTGAGIQPPGPNGNCRTPHPVVSIGLPL